jgi:hypothetical protein
MSVTFVACSSSAMVTKSSVSDTLKSDDITKAVTENSAKIKFFEAEGTIDFDAPDNNNSASILIRRDVRNDSIYAKLSGIFGITGALISVNAKSFIYYNVQNAYIIKGSTTKENLESILKIQIDYNELKNLICCSFIIDSSYHNIKVNSDDKNYILTGYRNGNMHKYYIDTESKMVSKYIYYNIKGNIEYRVEYKNYKVFNETYFPTEILFDVPDKKEKVKINYSDVNLNPNNLKFYFKIPKNVTLYQWQ